MVQIIPELNSLGRIPKYYIFRSKITIKGVTFFAIDYGHKAFRIPIY